MEILKFSNHEQQSTELAKSVAAQIQDLLQSQAQVCLAVSGGQSPILFFQKLSNYTLPWEKVIITLVDERYVAVSDSASNARLVKTHLLINNAEKAFFSGLVSDSDTILDCVNNANLHSQNIDIAILGMGEDGHTASLFPCCKELKNALDPILTPEKYIITNPTSAKYQRIGLSLAGILEIPYLFIGINGTHKLEVISHAAQAASLDYPISQVLSKRKDSKIFWHA